jgi:NRAMP (natural resistance-associated macrophage protein)-like metal ion transporter
LRRSGKEFASSLGPGLISGVSDDDPSGIATYAQAGARYGNGLLWTALFSWPLAAAVQEICDRTALATGKDLAPLAVDRLGKGFKKVFTAMLVALMLANTLNIAADLLAVGSGMELLHAGPAWAWAAIAGIGLTSLLIAGSFKVIDRVFKLLCLSLLSYIVVVIIVVPSWSTVLTSSVVPHLELSRGFLAILVAVLGTTISPYLFFWQSAHRIENLRERSGPGLAIANLETMTKRRARRTEVMSRADVFFGVGFSTAVMWAIIAATAATIGTSKDPNIGSAAQAATALRPLAGSFASAVFALGFIGAGLIAIPVLAGSTASALSALFGRRWGFDSTLRHARAFYLLVMVATVGGIALTLFGLDPIHLLVITAIVNGVIASPFLVVVMLVSGSHDIMGTHRNGRLASILGWTTAAVMACCGLAVILMMFL